MRILILGSTGMLGHMVLKVLSQEKEWEVIGVSSDEFSVVRFLEDSPSARRRTVLDESWDYVINCIGVLADGEEAQMKKVNTEFPHRLAKATNAKIINMSTDGVFSGRPPPPPQSSPIKGEEDKGGSPPLMGGVRGGWQGGVYYEDSTSDATDPYGKSKLAGEVNAPNVLNIRTSIIGPSPYKKKGLLEWFLAQPDGATVKGYTNHIWNGVTTLQFARLCEKIIREDVFDKLRAESHVFHFAPNEPVTKHELLCLFKKVFEKDVTVEPVEDPFGAVERVLTTKYKGIKKLFPHGVKMEKAVEQLNNLITQ